MTAIVARRVLAWGKRSIAVGPVDRITRSTVVRLAARTTIEQLENRQLLSAVYDNFDTASTDFANNFTPTLGSFSWGATTGILDQGIATGGAGVTTAGGDSTAVYNMGTTSLADGLVHTISVFVKDSDASTANKPLQIGWLAAANQSFNGTETVNGVSIKPSFISARLLGFSQVNAQSGSNGATASVATTSFAAAATSGDWLQLTVTAQETNTTTGLFTVTYSVTDYGQTGNSPGVVLLGPTTAMETSAGMANVPGYSGFHGLRSGYTIDNFSLDPANSPQRSDAQHGYGGKQFGCAFLAAPSPAPTAIQSCAAPARGPKPRSR